MNASSSFIVLLTAVAMCGCAAERYHSNGLALMKEGKPEEGLASLARAVSEEPTNASYKTDYYARRSEHVERLLKEATDHRYAGRLDDAEALYRRVMTVDALNVRARTGIQELGRERRHLEAIKSAREAYEAGDLERAATGVRTVLAESQANASAIALAKAIGEARAARESAEPRLKLRTNPVNLELRDANIRMAFEGIAKSTGINFVIDKDVRPDLRTTIFLKNAPVEDAIELILETGQLAKKVLNDNTLLIFPATKEKRNDYQELIIKAFYLQNVDASKMQNTIKTMLKAQDVVVDDKLNLLIMRDTPQAVRLAEKLIAVQDIAEPEVMLEVEVLEVQRNRLTAIGIQWPNQLTLTPLGAGGKSGALTLDDLNRLSASNVGATVSDAIVKLQHEMTDANILANPRIRVKNHETAKILVGDRVPVVTTTTTSTGFVSDSVQYLDVGLKLDVQPDIHRDDDVAIKVSMEVSSIVKEIVAANGTRSYQIGTRNASTVLRLRDGETQILAGLISDQERTSANGVPILGQMPLLGRLFSSQQDDRNKTEVVLSITPRLVRNVVQPDAWESEFWSGTESRVRTRPLLLRQAGESSARNEGMTAVEPSKREEDKKGTDSPDGEVAVALNAPRVAKVGEEFSLAITVKSSAKVRSLPLQVAYDSSALQVVRVEEGGYLRGGDGRTTFASNISEADGRLFLSVIRSNIDGVAGEGQVAMVTFRAIASKDDAFVRMLTLSPIVEGAPPTNVGVPPPHMVKIEP